jgi:hypothetical protein
VGFVCCSFSSFSFLLLSFSLCRCGVLASLGVSFLSFWGCLSCLFVLVLLVRLFGCWVLVLCLVRGFPLCRVWWLRLPVRVWAWRRVVLWALTCSPFVPCFWCCLRFLRRCVGGCVRRRWCRLLGVRSRVSLRRCVPSCLRRRGWACPSSGGLLPLVALVRLLRRRSWRVRVVWLSRVGWLVALLSLVRRLGAGRSSRCRFVLVAFPCSWFVRVRVRCRLCWVVACGCVLLSRVCLLGVGCLGGRRCLGVSRLCRRFGLVRPSPCSSRPCPSRGCFSTFRDRCPFGGYFFGVHPRMFHLVDADAYGDPVVDDTQRGR